MQHVLDGTAEDGPDAGRALREGARRFDAGAFLDAHEVWEARWRRAGGAERLRLQGLILAAAALWKRERGVARGAAGLWRRGRAKLAAARALEGDAALDVAAFVAGIDAALAGASPPPRLVPLLRGER